MIYFDNSATTNPKPKNVIFSANRAMINFSFNSGRGGYRHSVKAAERIFDTREKIGTLFNIEPQNIAFTQNCTLALNMAIKGSVSKGDHVIISNLEHNAVARAVEALALKGIVTYDTACFSYDPETTVNNFKSLIKSNTTLIVCMQASNVFGCVFPVKEIGKLARDNGIRFITDAAQSAGVFDIDVKRDNIDILCTAGHKGLYGPMGTGFMAVSDENIKLETVIEGGTGSSSMSLSQPDFMPDRFESGTLNNSGIIALGAGVDFVNNKGIKNIYTEELSMISMLYCELDRNPKVKLYTPAPKIYETAPILSFNYDDYSSEKTSSLLAENGIATRGGLHCAPLAHKAFGTQDRGTVRISPSVFNNYNECEIFIKTLKKL